MKKPSNMASAVDGEFPILFHTERARPAATDSQRWAALNAVSKFSVY